MTQWVFNGNVGELIEDSAPCINPWGTRYPGNWPKADIPGLVAVVETDQPTDPTLVITGSHVELIGGIPTRVWETALRPEPGPPSVPSSISKRQFLLAACADGLITPAEAIAAASTGAVPSSIYVVLTTLPADTQVAFRITWAAMVQVDRNHPFVPVMAQAFDKDDAEIDEFFRSASSL